MYLVYIFSYHTEEPCKDVCRDRNDYLFFSVCWRKCFFHPDCQQSLSAVQAAGRVNKEIIFSEKLIRSSVMHGTHKLGRLYLQVTSAAADDQSPGGPNPN